MEIKADEIASVLKQQIQGFKSGVDVTEEGSIIAVGDGIARVYGLENCMAGELLELPPGVFGMALNLQEEAVGVVLLGEFVGIKEGDKVPRTGRLMGGPGGDAVVGGAVKPVRQPLAGK